MNDQDDSLPSTSDAGLSAAATSPTTLPSGWRHEAHDSLASTNQTALAAAAAGAAAGLVITARAQQAGRGRQGRDWASPPGNFYGSWLLRPQAPPALWPTLSFVAGVALADTLIEMLPDPVGAGLHLKWPNDLLHRGAKLAGILLEADGQGALVIGCGVNLASAPTGLETAATALADHGVVIPPEQLLPVLIARFEAWYGRWQRDGFAPVRAAWLLRGHRPGDRLRLRDRGERQFLDLDQDGTLLVTAVDRTDMPPERVRAGDVLLID